MNFSSSARTILLGIRYSPWTEKACWALDEQGIDYRYREHVVLLGLPELVWRARKWPGQITVPLLCHDGEKGKVVCGDSWDVARFADDSGQKRGALFPEMHLSEIRELNELSEKALDSARGAFMIRAMRHQEIWPELLPAWIPTGLRGWLRGMAWLGLAYVCREFRIGGKSEQQLESEVAEVMREFRARLSRSGGRYLIGDAFSYADIVVATSLQGIKPLAGNAAGLGEGTRKCWTSQTLENEFGDLLAWRDRLYSLNRSRQGRMA